jgi:hypothetical protein
MAANVEAVLTKVQYVIEFTVRRDYLSHGNHRALGRRFNHTKGLVTETKRGGTSPIGDCYLLKQALFASKIPRFVRFDPEFRTKAQLCGQNWLNLERRATPERILARISPRVSAGSYNSSGSAVYPGQLSYTAASEPVLEA